MAACGEIRRSLSEMSILLVQVKKESAQTEPAWKGAGEKVGLQIWRIVNFKARFLRSFLALSRGQ